MDLEEIYFYNLCACVTFGSGCFSVQMRCRWETLQNSWEMTWKAGAIFFELILAGAVQWERTLTCCSGIHPPFHPKENYTSASPTPRCSMLWQSCWYKHNSFASSSSTRKVSTFLFCLLVLFLACILVQCYGLLLSKVRQEVSDGRTWGGVLQMSWLPRRLGIQQPHERRVITPTHEGVATSVWQSSHNSGLIHHMGIMLLTGTTPKKSYTRSNLASESLNNPSPLLCTHCLVGETQAKWTGVIDLKKKTFILGCVPLWKQLVYVVHTLSLFLSKSLWHVLLIALIRGINQDPYQLDFPALSLLWKSRGLHQYTLIVSYNPTTSMAKPISLSS